MEPFDQRMLEAIYVASEFIDPLNDIVARIQGRPEGPISRPFIVLRHGEPVSFFTIETASPHIDGSDGRAGVYWLESFFITRDFVGKGHGKAVVSLLLEMLPVFFPDASALKLTVNARNRIARKLYRRCGFVDTGEMTFQGPAGPQHVYEAVDKRRLGPRCCVAQLTLDFPSSERMAVGRVPR